jgi:hypothetical protein
MVANDLPLVGGLCLVQRTSTTQGLKICPSSEDFVSYNGLRPRRASRICPSSEDFVSYNGLRPRRASRSAPRRRTLSRRNGLRPKQTGPEQQKKDEPTRTMPNGANRRIEQAKRPNRAVFTWRRRKILRWTLGRCYGGLCVLAVVERLDENVVSKDQ